MRSLFKKISRMVSHMVISLVSTGLILVLLGILIVWTDFMLKLVVGLFVLVIAYTFFHLAYKIWKVKKEVEKFLKF